MTTGYSSCTDSPAVIACLWLNGMILPCSDANYIFYPVAIYNRPVGKGMRYDMVSETITTIQMGLSTVLWYFVCI